MNTYQSIFNYLFVYAKSNDIDINIIQEYVDYIKYLTILDFSSYSSFEKHHVLPRSWGGKDPKLWNGKYESENIIRIPIKYHILVHKLLSKTNDKDMLIAYHRTVNSKLKIIKNIFAPNEIVDIISSYKEANAKAKNKIVINLTTKIEYPGATAAGRAMGLSDKSVITAIRTKTKCAGCWWQYKCVLEENNLTIEQQIQIYEQESLTRYNNRISAIKNKANPVVNLTKKKLYNSIEEAVRCSNGKCSDGTIRQSINKQVLAGGSYWLYEYQLNGRTYEQALQDIMKFVNERMKKWIDKQTTNKKSRMRAVVNLNTKEVYSGVTEVLRKYNNKGNLSSCIAIKSKFHGCYWQYKDVVDQSSIEEELQKYIDYHKMKSNKYKVINTITNKIYDSVQSAAKDNNYNCRSLMSALQRRQNFLNGKPLHLKFVD